MEDSYRMLRTNSGTVKGRHFFLWNFLFLAFCFSESSVRSNVQVNFFLALLVATKKNKFFFRKVKKFWNENYNHFVKKKPKSFVFQEEKEKKKLSLLLIFENQNPFVIKKGKAWVFVSLALSLGTFFLALARNVELVILTKKCCRLFKKSFVFFEKRLAFVTLLKALK